MSLLIQKIKTIYFYRITLLLFWTSTLFSQIPGNLQLNWAHNPKAYPVGGYVSVNGVARDANGNCYIAGTFSGTADFDPSPITVDRVAVGGTDIFIAKYDSLGNYIFAKSCGGSGNDNAQGIVLDVSGNIFITGSFNGVADFDPSAGTATVSTISGNSNLSEDDVYLAKYDASGNYLFAVNIKGSGYDIGKSIAIDNSGSILIAGNFIGTADFDPSPASATISSTGSNSNVFFAKYSNIGNLIWAKKIGTYSTTSLIVNGLAIDTSEAVYLTGRLSGVADFDPSPTITFNLNSYDDDVFVAKYSSAGNYVFAKLFGGIDNQEGASIAIGKNKSIYITGKANVSCNFSLSPGGTGGSIINTAGFYDVFIARYDSACNFIYGNLAGSAITNESGISIDVDNTGNAYVTGVYRGAADFDPSPSVLTIQPLGTIGIFFAKYSPIGNLILAQNINSDGPGSRSVFLNVVNGNNVYVSGFFNYNLYNGITPTNTLICSDFATEGFVLRLNTSGVFINAFQIGGYTNSYKATYNSIKIDDAGNIYATGTVNGPYDFDPSIATASLSVGASFLAKYSPSGALLYVKRIVDAVCLELDALGNIYLAGAFTGTVDFDFSSVTTTLSTPYLVYDMFFAKYDNNLNFIYAKSLKGSYNNSISSLKSLNSGEIYISGNFNNTVDFDPSPATNTIASNTGTRDFFIAKYDAIGNLVFVNAIGGTSNEDATGMEIDTSGVYITGTINSLTGIDFDPSPATATLSSNGLSVFIAKYDKTGNYVFAFNIKSLSFGSYSTLLNAIALDNNGAVCIGGQFSGMLDCDPSAATNTISSSYTYDLFIAKYDRLGNFMFAKPILGNAIKHIYAIAIDSLKNTVITGDFEGSTDFNPSPTNQYSLTASVGKDVFIARYDSVGQLSYAGALAGSGNNGSGKKVLLKKNGSELVLVGTYTGSIDCDPSAGVNQLNSTNAEYFSCFIAKYGVCNGVASPLNITPSSSQSICLGSTTTLSAAGSGSLAWMASSTSTVIQANGNNLVVTPTSIGNYTYYATASNSCVTNPFYTPVVISVLSNPTIGVLSGSICAGNSFTLTPSGASTYSFSNGSAIVTPTSTTTYSISGTNSFGCLSSNTAVASITVIPQPTVAIVNATLCHGLSHLLQPTGANSYSFSSGSALVSPTTSSSYSVIGFSTQGCVSANTAVANISVLPSPTLALNGATICSGLSHTFTPSGAVSYTFSSGSAVVSPSSTGQYTVTGIASNGCQSMTVANLVVLPSPPISINSGTLCSGKSFTFLPTGAVSFTISGGNTIVSPIATTVYSVIGTSSLGCVSTTPATATLIVYNSPSVSVSNATICSGQSHTLQPMGAHTYTYSGGTQVVVPSSSAAYSITGTSTAGCLSTNTAVANIIVNASPTITANNGTICAGESFTLAPSGASTYSYSSGTSIVSPVSSSSYIVSGTGSNNCVGTSSVMVLVNPLPTISVPNGSLCAGSSYTLLPSGASSYSFSSGSAIVFPSANTAYTIYGSSNGCQAQPVIANLTVFSQPTITVNSGSICSGFIFTLTPSGANNYFISGGQSTVSPISTTAYSISGISNQGCASSNTAVAIVSVVALPIISVNSGSICEGNAFLITPSGANTYTISGGNFTVNPTTTSSYSVIGTSSAGCVSSVQAISQVSVNAKPTIVATLQKTVMCVSESNTVLASGGLTYSWSTGATGNSIVITASVVANQVINLTGIDANGCSNTSSVLAVVDACLDIKHEGANSGIVKLFPNPSNGLVYLTLDKSPEQVVVLVHNSLGQLVTKKEISVSSSVLDLGNELNGIYVITVLEKNRVIHTSKIVKQ